MAVIEQRDRRDDALLHVDRHGEIRGPVDEVEDDVEGRYRIRIGKIAPKPFDAAKIVGKAATPAERANAMP